MLLEPVVIITSEVRPLSCLNIYNLDRLCMQLLVVTVLSVILELQLPWPFGRAGSVTKSLFAFSLSEPLPSKFDYGISRPPIEGLISSIDLTYFTLLSTFIYTVLVT